MDHMCELLTLSLYFIIYSSAGNAFLMPVSHCLAQCLDQLIIEHKSVEVGSPCSRQGDIENRKGYSLVLKTRVKIWQKYSRKPWSHGPQNSGTPEGLYQIQMGFRYSEVARQCHRSRFRAERTFYHLSVVGIFSRDGSGMTHPSFHRELKHTSAGHSDVIWL